MILSAYELLHGPIALSCIKMTKPKEFVFVQQAKMLISVIPQKLFFCNNHH